MASPSKFALPFVVTLATAALACGGTAIVEDGGGGNGGTGGSTNSTTNNASSSGSSSTTVNPTTCPAEAPGPYESCDTGPEVCSYEILCQSSVQVLQFVCGENAWEIVPNACDLPHDSCAGTEYHCAGSWWMPESTNPPSPCPDSLPTVGEACFSGGMGGVWDQCGYKCDDTPEAAWTIASCPLDMSPSAWVHDGACDP